MVIPWDDCGCRETMYKNRTKRSQTSRRSIRCTERGSCARRIKRWWLQWLLHGQDAVQLVGGGCNVCATTERRRARLDYCNSAKTTKRKGNGMQCVETTAGRTKEQETEKVDECGSENMALGTKQLPIFTSDSSQRQFPPSKAARGSTRQPQTRVAKPRAG